MAKGICLPSLSYRLRALRSPTQQKTNFEPLTIACNHNMNGRLETRNRDPNNDRGKNAGKRLQYQDKIRQNPPSASLPPCIERCAEERMGADHPEPKQGKTKNRDECWITRITWTGPHDVDLKPQNRSNGTVAAAQSLRGRGDVRRESGRCVN